MHRCHLHPNQYLALPQRKTDRASSFGPPSHSSEPFHHFIRSSPCQLHASSLIAPAIQGMAANVDGQPLLHTFQKHIEDMRSLVQCKICIKPLYEPFILSCGHSYCYSCLTSWFTGGDGDHRRRQNMKCPDCRAAVVLEPSPNYVVGQTMQVGSLDMS